MQYLPYIIKTKILYILCLFICFYLS